MENAKPPRLVEAAVSVLIPPERREDVLGDLYERYSSPPQYIADAVQMIPAIIWGRIRRTTDRRTLLIEFCGVYICFLSAVLLLAPMPAEPLIPVRALIPAMVMELVFVVANAYERAGRPRSLALIAVISAAVAVDVRVVLSVVAPQWTISGLQAFALGCAGGVLVHCGSRQLFRRVRRLNVVEPCIGEERMEGQNMSEREREFKSEWRREILGRLLAVAFVVLLGVTALLSDRPLDRAAGGAILALALYTVCQTWRHWSMMAADPSDSPEARFRRQLEQQRKYLRRSWSWFVAPFLCALLLFTLRMAPENWPKAAPFGVLVLGWSIAMVHLSLRAARNIQSEIDDLDRGRKS
jgi:hypothetical protein